MLKKIQTVVRLVVIMLATPHPLIASTIESPIDTTGLAGFVSLAYGDHTVNSLIANGVEVDNYRFQGEPGDSIRVIVSTQSSGLDPELVLRDPDGAVLQTNSCSGSFPGSGISCSLNIDQTLSNSGTYFLNLSDSGSNEAGNYTLHLDRYPPSDNWVGLGYDTPLDDQLGHSGDFDFLAFNGAAGTGVKVTVASTTSGVDPQLEIWDPMGGLMAEVSCNGSFSGSGITCSVDPELSLLESGVYRIGISDVGWNEIGNYSVGVSCLFGECPSIAPIPLPLAAWLFGSGILALIGIIRISGD